RRQRRRMSLISFSFPTHTLYGAGALRALPEHLKRLGISRPLVVTDAGVASTDAFQSLRRVLGESDHDKSWFVFSGTNPNPVEANLRDAASMFQDRECDGVIAFGGGSALDVGKAARLLIKRPGFDLT